MMMERILQIILLLYFLSFTRAKEYDVIILGAGLSGIGAAEYLHSKKFTNFLVLEGKDYIGGRLKSENFHGLNVELGANWIHHADDNHDIAKLANELNLKTMLDSYNDFIYRNGSNGNLYRNSMAKNLKNHLHYKLRKMYKLLEKRIKDGKSDISLQAGLRWAGWTKDNTFAEAVEYFAFDFENGVNIEQISASATGITGGGKDNFVIDERGYKFLIQNSAKKFRNKIILNQEVSSIQRFKNKYSVYTKEGPTFKSKHVLVTFSSGVLNSRKVRFYPDLPDWKYEALTMVPMTHYCKIFLLFSQKFWDDSNYIIFTNKIRGHYMHWMNLHKYVGKNMLLATLTGNMCQDSHFISDAEIKKEAFKALKKVYKNAVEPIDMIRNNWSNDKFFQGAYSYVIPGITDDDYIGIAHPVQQSLWFAGEYTNGEEYGFTHGALATGKKAARNIYECIHDSSKCPPKNPPFSFKKNK